MIERKTRGTQVSPGRTLVLVALAVVATLLPVALPAVASGVGAGGPRDQMPAGEPGTAKAGMIARFQAEYESALRTGMAPPAGRPQEGWKPELVEGIDNAAESPFEGSDFVLSNMWQSALRDGTVTQVYAGAVRDQSKLVVIRLRVMEGINELMVEVPLPARSGTPRITADDNGILRVATSSGRLLRFDVARRTLSAAD